MEPDEPLDPDRGRDTDPVSAALDRAAARLDVPTAPIARAQVDRRAARRTRRTRSLAAVAAVAALGVGGVVVAASLRSDDEPTGVSETPITEPTDTEPDVTGGDTRPVSTDPSVTDPTMPEVVEVPTSDSVPSETTAPVVGGAPTAAPWSGPVVAAELVDVEPLRQVDELFDDAGWAGWLVPWGDGFLTSTRPVPEQPLPERFPAEISERFPQEVRDLFAEGLPATVQEATEMLQEAGLYDVVSEIVLADPEVYDAIYGDVQFTAFPDPEVFFSTDGVGWQQVEFTLPPGFEPNGTAASSGERLALLGTPSSVPGDDPMSRKILLASTTDLVTWEVVEVDGGVPPLELPDTFDLYSWPQSLSLTDDRWIVPVQRAIEPRLEELVPADIMNGGFATEMDREGMTVRPDDGSDADSFSITWEEMGATPELLEEYGGLGGETILVSGSWEVTPATLVSSARHAWNAVAARDGYYAQAGEAVDYSSDGTRWDRVALPGDSWVSSMFVINGRAAAIVESASEPGASRLFLLAGVDEPPELIDLPLPPGSSTGGSPQAGDGAVILELWNEDGSARWVLAASEEGRWLVEELPAGAGEYFGPATTARSGSTVLAYSEEEWSTYDLS